MSQWWKMYKTQTTVELSFKLCRHNVLWRHQKPSSLVLQETGSCPGKHIQMHSNNNWTLQIWVLTSVCIPEELRNASAPNCELFQFSFHYIHVCSVNVHLWMWFSGERDSLSEAEISDFTDSHKATWLQLHYHTIIIPSCIFHVTHYWLTSKNHRLSSFHFSH